MKNWTYLTILLVLSMTLVGCGNGTEDAPQVEADAQTPASPLAGVTQMEHIYGPEITPDDLIGQVVLFDYWGRQCPPCQASFPHLVELQEEYGATGRFMIVASHVQTNPGLAAEFCEEKNVNFPVYQQLRLPADDGDGYIPYLVLFDHEGNVVASGRGDHIYEMIPDLVAAAVAANDE